jgi:ATP-dependent protease ClpP protease subunit
VRFLFYHGAVNPQGARNLEILLRDAVVDGHDEVTVCICSDGGDVTAGIGLYNFMRMLPMKVNMHSFGVCGSIAGTIYLAGHRRTCASASLFQLHASSYVSGPQAGQIAENTKLISAPFRTRLNWTDKQIDRFFSSSKETWFTPEEAKELGMTHSIEDLEMKSGDEIVHVVIP